VCFSQADPRAVSVSDNTVDESAQLQFTFDHVFAPEASQADVFDTVATQIAGDAMRGYNSTVIAYG